MKLVELLAAVDLQVAAAKNLDSVVNTLVTNFSEGSDYFKVLVNVFQSVFLNSTEHDHLKTFLMIGILVVEVWIIIVSAVIVHLMD